jgi:hypothetical protein
VTAHASTPGDERVDHHTAGVVFAAASIVVAAIGLAFRPALLTPLAVILALISAGLSGRRRTLAAAAVVIAGLAWFVGMTIALFTDTPLY